jgi:hypothetical protein
VYRVAYIAATSSFIRAFGILVLLRFRRKPSGRNTAFLSRRGYLTSGARHLLDRFLHHATVVSITGESYRLKDAALAKSKPKES